MSGAAPPNPPAQSAGAVRVTTHAEQRRALVARRRGIWTVCSWELCPAAPSQDGVRPGLTTAHTTWEGANEVPAVAFGTDCCWPGRHGMQNAGHALRGRDRSSAPSPQRSAGYTTGATTQCSSLKRPDLPPTSTSGIGLEGASQTTKRRREQLMLRQLMPQQLLSLDVGLGACTSTAQQPPSMPCCGRNCHQVLPRHCHGSSKGSHAYLRFPA